MKIFVSHNVTYKTTPARKEALNNKIKRMIQSDNIALPVIGSPSSCIIDAKMEYPDGKNGDSAWDQKHKLSFTEADLLLPNVQNTISRDKH